jgi:hypothetical protein
MSTYHVRYRLEFDDIHNVTPAKWKVDISVRDDIGSVSGLYELTGSDTPLIITRGTQSNDKFEPILGSEVQIGVTLTDDLPDDAKPYFTRPPEPKDFFTIDETQLKVEIYKDSVLKWVGFCKPDYCEYTYSPTPYYFTIVATDRISLLKSQLVDLDTAKSGDGYMSILSLLKANGLYKTGLSESLKVISSLQYNGSGAMLEDKKIRYELLVDDSGNPMNVYDSLVQIANSLGCRIFFEDNTFWFQRIEDLMTEVPTVLTYGTTETPTSSTLHIRKIVKGEISSAEAIYSDIPSIQIGAAYKQTQIDLDYKFRGWLQNFNWLTWDGSNFAHWTKNTHATIDRHGSGTDEDPYTLYFAKNSSDTGILWQVIDGIPQGALFSMSAKIKFLKTQRCAFRLYICKTATGSQDPSDDSLKEIVWLNGNWGDAQSNLGSAGNIPVTRNEHNDLDFSLDINNTWSLRDDNGFPYDPDVTFSLLIYILDPDGSFSESGSYTGMEVGEIILSVKSNNINGEIDTVRLTKDYSTLNSIDNNALIDSSVYVANSVYTDTSVTNTKWKTDYIQTAMKLQSVNLYSRLNVYQLPYKIMSGTFFSNIISFENVIQQAFGDYSLFIQMYDEYDVKKCSHKMQLAEINHGVLNTSNIESSVTKYKTT